MVEWAKSRARAQHWVEEVRLLDAEMQRAIDFNESMALAWDARRAPAVTIELGADHAWTQDAGWADGARAYASKQASIRRAQAAKWRKQFSEPRMEAQRFLTVHTSEGFSVEPLQFLSPEEVEDMMRRAGRRREKRTMKVNRAKARKAAVDKAREAAEEEDGSAVEDE